MARIRKTSTWNESEIAKFLESTVIPIRLACGTPRGPLICSLWYLWDDGALWCATQQSASVVELLRQDPACGFEVAPETMPYKGVRGQGQAELRDADGEAVLLKLLDRYVDTRDSKFAQWLLQRADTETAVRIKPAWMTAWDFSNRMQA